MMKLNDDLMMKLYIHLLKVAEIELKSANFFLILMTTCYKNFL